MLICFCEDCIFSGVGLLLLPIFSIELYLRMEFDF